MWRRPGRRTTQNAYPHMHAHSGAWDAAAGQTQRVEVIVWPVVAVRSAALVRERLLVESLRVGSCMLVESARDEGNGFKAVRNAPSHY